MSVDEPSNLLAHHVKVLERAGVVTRHRSEGDRRRTYLTLAPDALDTLRPTPVRYAGVRVGVRLHRELCPFPVGRGALDGRERGAGSVGRHSAGPGRAPRRNRGGAPPRRPAR